MRKIVRENRRFWCHQCKKDVVLEPKLWCDICPDCRVELKPRMSQDFIEISDEEYRRQFPEGLKDDIPERE